MDGTATPPGPDSGVPGQSATPDATLDANTFSNSQTSSGGNTYNYYNNSTVNNSTGGVSGSSAGNTGTQTGNQGPSDITVEVDLSGVATEATAAAILGAVETPDGFDSSAPDFVTDFDPQADVVTELQATVGTEPLGAAPSFGFGFGFTTGGSCAMPTADLYGNTMSAQPFCEAWETYGLAQVFAWLLYILTTLHCWAVFRESTGR